MRSTIIINPNCSSLTYTAFIFVLTFTLFGAACNNCKKETARMQSSHAPSDGPEFTGNPHPHQTGNPISILRVRAIRFRQ